MNLIYIGLIINEYTTRYYALLEILGRAKGPGSASVGLVHAPCRADARLHIHGLYKRETGSSDVGILTCDCVVVDVNVCYICHLG